MTTEANKPQGVQYSVESGRVYRDDGDNKESVAKYDAATGIVEMLPEKRNYRVAVIRHLNDKGYKFVAVGKIGMDLKRSDAPARPKKSRQQGDKTPAVVEWYAKHAKEEFLEKYSVREMQIRVRVDETTTMERDPRTGVEMEKIIRTPVYERVDGFDYDIQKLKTGEHRLVGDCKTHITEKTVGNVSDLEYDDELDQALTRQREQARKAGKA
jgi:hypothetical protein